MSAQPAAATPAQTLALFIEYEQTLDLPTGQPVPPCTGHWAIVSRCRLDGTTLWRCVSLGAAR
jgi:hypothetical protein